MSKSSYKRYVPLVLFILLVILSFMLIKPFLLSVFLSALLAYICYPLYQLLLRKINNKTISALIVCILVLLILIVPGIFLVKTLVQESYVLYIGAKQKLAGGLLADCSNAFCQKITEFGQNPDVQFKIQEVVKAVTNFVISKGSDFLLSVPRIVLNLFVIFFTLFYFLIDGKKFLKEIGHHLSLGKKKYFMKDVFM